MVLLAELYRILTVMAYTFNLSTREAEANEYLSSRSACVQRKFQKGKDYSRKKNSKQSI